MRQQVSPRPVVALLQELQGLGDRRRPVGLLLAGNRQVASRSQVLVHRR